MEIDTIIANGKVFIDEEIRVEKEEYDYIHNEETYENLEKIGFAISNFTVKKVKIAYFKKKMVTFAKINDQFFHEKLRIKTGDNVIIAEKSKIKEKSPINQLFFGVVHKLNQKTIQILFDPQQKIDFETQFSNSSLILKSFDNVTYDRSG